jgi:hypothetical protein
MFDSISFINAIIIHYKTFPIVIVLQQETVQRFAYVIRMAVSK